MAEKIGFENGRNSNFQRLVTLTLDPAIRHTIVHHSSTSTYYQISLKSKKLFVDGRTYGRTDVRTDIFPPSNIIRSTFGSRPKNDIQKYDVLQMHFLDNVKYRSSYLPHRSNSFFKEMIVAVTC